MSSTVSDGLASFAKIKSDIGLVVGGILATIFIVVGIYLIATDNEFANVTGTLLSKSCIRGVNNTTNCNLSVTYTINGQKYTQSTSTLQNITNPINSSINLTYNKSNPTSVTVQQTSRTTIGIILILVGLAVGGVSWLGYYLTHKYKAFATFEGAVDVARLL